MKFMCGFFYTKNLHVNCFENVKRKEKIVYKIVDVLQKKNVVKKITF